MDIGAYRDKVGKDCNCLHGPGIKEVCDVQL